MSKGISFVMKDLYSTKFMLPIVLILGFVFFFYLDLDYFFTWNNIRINYSELSLISAENFLYSSFIFFIVFFLATAFSLPVLSVLSLLGGALFGWLAVLLCLLSGVLGCWVVFFATRGFLFEYLSKKSNPFIESITTNFNKGPFIWLLSLKLFPLLPITFGNIVPGVLGMKSSTFLLATFLGFIPGNLIYVSFGKGISRLIIDEEIISLSVVDNPDIYIPLICLLLISVTSFVIKLNKIKKEKY
jgi:uncharacterized membrane protein YdjX (TVP38/TMEM64 family)